MDQADRLRELMDIPRRRARVIAVASGKGGVGKTHLAVNLGLSLVRLGRRVILVDLDIGLANADVLLGVEARRGLGNVLAGEVEVLDALIPCPGGLLLLAGSNAAEISDLSTQERAFLVQTFRSLEAHADILIIDTGAGISSNVIEFCRSADEVLLVTTPEPTAITDGYALIKTVTREKGTAKIQIVVNQAMNRLEAGIVSDRVRSVSKRFLGVDVSNLGYVLVDERVRRAARRRKPFALDCPRSTASVCVRAIAERLLGNLESTGTRRTGFLKRFSKGIGVSRNSRKDCYEEVQ